MLHIFFFDMFKIKFTICKQYLLIGTLHGYNEIYIVKMQKQFV